MTEKSTDNLTINDEPEKSYKKKEFVNRTFELDNSIAQKQIDKDENSTSNFMDFDDLLPHIGEFGRYQKILFLLMIPFAFFLVFVYFTQIFITLVPEHHWCWVPELEHLSADERFVYDL